MTAERAAVLAASKHQIRRLAAFARCLSAVAGHGVVRPWQMPVVGALGGPAESPRTLHMDERPFDIAVDVADKSEFAGGHQHFGHPRQRRVLHEAALPVALLRPWV